MSKRVPSVIIKKKSILPINKEAIKAICIDDFALKKRQNYGTLMIDLKNGRVIDLIESRERKDVAIWLSLFPNIQFVSRDGSPAYAAAIRQAHPDAHHISDRFHLIKRLIDALTLCMQNTVAGRIIIPLTKGQHAMNELLVHTPSRRTKILLVKSLASEGRTLQDIRSQTKFSLQTIRKYMNMREEDIPEDAADQRGREHQEAIRKVMEKAEEVRSMHKKGYSTRKIVDKTGYTHKTINNYLAPDFNPINGQYGVRRPGKLSPFRNEVLTLRTKGTTYKEIHAFIRQKGYTGSEAAIRQFIAKEKRLGRDFKKEATTDATEVIERKWLIKLLYKPLDKVKDISFEQVENSIQQYPLIGTLLDLIWDFKKILKSGKKEILHTWIAETESLELAELKSFLNGMKKDIKAVENACTLPYSNGLAEGSVNKLKTIKRIMYGRNSFALLRNKLLLLEARKFN